MTFDFQEVVRSAMQNTFKAHGPITEEWMQNVIDRVNVRMAGYRVVTSFRLRSLEKHEDTAPDMLDALKEAKKVMEDYAVGRNDPELNKAIYTVQKAIFKAVIK